MTSNLSAAMRVALLPPDERAAILDGMDIEELDYMWEFWRRPDQVVPNAGQHITMFSGGRGSGKELSLDTPIPTPAGWTNMGALSVGDEVFDERGKICRVLAVYDQDAPTDGAWRLTFSDGTVLVAGGAHQWVTWTHRDRKQYLRKNPGTQDFPRDWAEQAPVRTTTNLIETFTHSTRGDRNHCVPLAGSLKLAPAELIIDPYLLGYWLGDGSSKAAELTVGDNDLSHLTAYLDSLGHPYKLREGHPAWRVFLTSEARSSGNPLAQEQLDTIHDLRGTVYAKDIAVMLGISTSRVFSVWEKQQRVEVPHHSTTFQNKLSTLNLINNKHIPREYLRASEEQRLALLRGLMDSDGYADGRKSTVEFVSVNQQLAEDVCELARTLSERPVLAKGVAKLYGVEIGPKYRVTWRPSVHTPFLMERKAAKILPPRTQALRLRHRMLTMYERTDDQPMRCITVDSPNSMYLAGEGMIPTHNTRCESEWIREKARTMPGSRGLLCARTAADARDVLVMGDSGILSVHPPSEMPIYEPTKRLLTWPNHTTAQLYSSESPNALRGPQGHWGVAEELSTWLTIPDDSGLTAWDNLQIAVRLGDLPQIFVATTPKRTKVIRELLARAATDPGVVLMHSTTRANMGNLSRNYIDLIYNKYKGTSLEAQELEGMLLDDVEGALWTLEVLDRTRVEKLPSDVEAFVVAVDPSVSENRGDLAGIVVIGSTNDRIPSQRSIYVVEDASLQGTPQQWVEEAVRLAHEYEASIVIERNQGGRLLIDAIHSVDHRLKVHSIQARASKQLRAEPVVLSFERGQTHIVGELPMLEQELLSWVPDTKMKSPDRLDAMVYGVAYFLADVGRGGFRPKTGVKITSAAQRRLPRFRY